MSDISKDTNPTSEEDDLFVHQDITVDKGQEPLRIDKFLMGRLTKVSRNRVQQGILAGSILVNDKPTKANYKVRPLDNVKVVLPHEPSEFHVGPEDIQLDIIYEDDVILIVNKPAGLVVHPGIGNWTGTLVNGLMYYYEQKALPLLSGNTPDRPGLVHRIDKDTSGLLVIAKTEYAMTKMAKQFFDHNIERSYWSLVWGNFEEGDGTITGNIGRHPTDRTKMHVYEEGEEGKHAVTHYKVLEDMYYVSLVECKLETGRTHQIRAHMNYLGHPVFNDARYGGDKVVKGTIYTKYRQFVENCFELCPRQALHARTLGFIHPTTGKEMFFEAPLPVDFENLLKKWRNYFITKKDLVSSED